MPRGRKSKSASMPKMKEIKDKRKAQKIVYESNGNSTGARKGKKPMPKYALKLTDDLYITHDSRSWVIVQKNYSKNKITGEYYPDKPFLWYWTLEAALKGAVQYKLKVPNELKEIADRIEDIYKLIDARIPKGIKPKDLFSDYIGNDELEEED